MFKAALVAGFIFASAIASAREIPLLGAETYPESLAYRASTATFFVGGAGDGSVQEVSDTGPARYFLPPGTLKEIYGVKIDDARGRLWLTDGASIFVYDLKFRSLIARVDHAQLSSATDSFLNDFAILADGTAIVTDSREARLFRIDGKTLAPTTLRTLDAIPFGKQNDIKYNLNGLVATPDGKAVISVKTNEGTLWKIPLDGAPIEQIPLARPVTHGDGLAWGPNGELIVARNYEDKVSVIEYQFADTVKPVRDLAAPGVATPTALVTVGTRVVIVNSQFAADQPALPFRLTDAIVSRVESARRRSW